MKTFREFIAEADSYTQVTDGSSYGGRMSSADIDARSDLTPEEKRKLKAKRTRVSGGNKPDSPFSGSGKPQPQPSASTGGGAPPTGTPAKPSAIVRSGPSALSTEVKPPVQRIPINSNVPGGRFAGVKNFIGKAATPVQLALDTGIETAAQKSRGRRTGSALTMGATKAAGGLAGMKAGAAGGAAIGSLAGPIGTAVGGVVGGIGGYMTGSGLAGKASEVVAGSTGKEKAVMAAANRQRQAGGGLAGIGGQTTFSKGKDGTGFMSTGVGNQRKTVQLAKTSVVKDPKTGKLETGNLAFKDGKAVYKRAADPSTLAQTSSNPLERVGRSLFAGAYKQQDEKARQSRLAQAVQSDIKRQRELGVKGSQNLVGPKIVGPKIVGPKPAK